MLSQAPTTLEDGLPLAVAHPVGIGGAALQSLASPPPGACHCQQELRQAMIDGCIGLGEEVEDNGEGP